VVDPGARHGPFPGRLAAKRIAAYAAATGDETPAVLAGEAVPAVFPAILAFDAQGAARADVPAAAWRQASGAVHGEHDIVLHRGLIPDEPLDTWSRICAVRTTRAGTQVVLHIEQFDGHGTMAVEQWWTTLLIGLHAASSAAAAMRRLTNCSSGMASSVTANVGSMPDDHRLPDSARDKFIGSATQHVGVDVAHRYAEVSGDCSAHHFDIDAARATGFDFLFTHGLCTMAICAHRLLGLAGVGDPGQVRRVAVRFASPTPLGADLTVNAYGINERSLAFEASCNGATVITHGRLEL